MKSRQIATNRVYDELAKLQTFEERYEYLRLKGNVGESTFGFDRYLNQMLYRSARWKRTRDIVIMRDLGCDLGIIGREIHDMIIVHHMNPILPEDIELEEPDVFNPNYLICTTSKTHRAIHYGDESLLQRLPKERRPGDTCPWR